MKLKQVTSIGIFIFLLSFESFVKGEVRGNDWKDLLLTASEKNALDKFKSRVIRSLPEEFMKTDFYLIRWLRAKNFNIREAQDMLFENVKWRERNNIKNILSESFDDIKDDFPYTFEGHDKHDRPIIILEMGEWDLRSGVLQGRVPRITRYMNHLQEEALQKILELQRNGKNVTRAITITNADGINLRQHLCPACLGVFIQLTVGMEDHYPGFWEEMIVVNAPGIAKIGVDAVKPVMSKQSREVLKILDTNKKQWMAYLNERISKDQRTARYGGTMKSINEI